MGFFDRLARVGVKVATVHGRPFACLVCQGREFTTREIKLNTGGAEFLDLAWANRSTRGLICTGCGYVHEFVGDAVRVRVPEDSDPAERT